MAEILHNTFTDKDICYGNPVGDNTYMLCVEDNAEIVILTRNQLQTMLSSVDDMMRTNEFSQPANEPELIEQPISGPTSYIHNQDA
jgi:hypothetical protein